VISIRSSFVATLLLSTPAIAQDVSSNWFRSPAISPDGKTVVFTHHGDLYSVPTKGGRAVPLTIHESYESNPVWSHDGQYLAFASDRNGNFDVYIMPATGGEATRLTYHSSKDIPSDFTPDNQQVIFFSTRTDDVRNAQFPSPILSELYAVSVNGGTPTMLLTTPAHNARFNASGDKIYYEDFKGYEDLLRKHHTSPVAHDLWVYDTATKKHTKLTDFAGEDRNPNLSQNGKSLYFLSERNGDFNIFKMDPQPGAQAQQITSFEHHPVRDLSRSAGTDMVFSWHGDLYSIRGQRQPKRIDIQIATDTAGDEPHSTSLSSRATQFSVSPNGKEVAFIDRGEVFVTSTEFATTRRITNTPEQERSVDFAPDGRALVYAGERGGTWNIYQTKLADDDELYFFSATKFEESPLVQTSDDEFQPAYSPDGNKVAYLHNRTTLNVIDLESKEIVTALPGDTYYSYADGDHWFDWSPDSLWLAVHYYTPLRLFTFEVGLVKADGSMTAPDNITHSGYEETNPRWAMGGGALLWNSDRYGQRSHGSFGAQGDVVAAFLTQDAFDKFRLSKEEYELQKELDDKRKKDDTKDDDAQNADDNDAPADADNADDADKSKDEEDVVEPIKIDLKNLDTRTMRLTINASTLGDFLMSPDGDKLYYLAQFEKGFDLWVRDFREESTKKLTKLNARSASMEITKEGDFIFLLAGGALAKIDTKSGEKKPIPFKADIEIQGPQERAYLFEHMWRQTKEKFYNPDMHGVDWDWYRAQYEPKLNGISNNRDLATIFSEILGELNASHTGGRYRPKPAKGAASTATLGVYYDTAYTGDGMKIKAIMSRGPLDKADLTIEPGMIITHVDGTLLTGNQNFYQLLEGKSGQRVRLSLQPDQGDPFDAVVKPAGFGNEFQWRYLEWIESRNTLVEKLSGGRLGYAHIRGMNDASFRNFFAEVLGKHADKEALIVDTRFNGGGWLHDDLVEFLSGKNYLNAFPRNVEDPGVKYYMEPYGMWAKPSVVIMSESNYSDAYIFPWAYSTLGVGKTIGTAVAGTGTAVWWETLHTGDLVFGIPQVGLKGLDGKYLENNLLLPDYEVFLDPTSAANGDDTQIREAVRVLLEQLDNDD
jgi:tricorn protease